MTMGTIWRRRAAILVALVALGAGIAWLLRPAPVSVAASTVTRGAFERTIDEEARTRVRERYVVSAPLGGRVLRLAYKAGDVVTFDAPVATILPSYPTLLDARTVRELDERVGAAEARLTAATATVGKAQAALALARSELVRVAGLASQGFISKQAQERAERDVELRGKELSALEQERHAFEHDLAVARAALAFARQPNASGNGDQFVVRAPAAGRVLRVVQESEAMVNVGAPLLEIGDPAALEVVADVLTTDAESIRPGNDVRLARGQGPSLRGRVRVVEPGAFTKVSALGVEEQRTRVVIDVTSPPETWSNLGDAFRLDASIVVDRQADVLKVPTAALWTVGDVWSVYRVVDGRARARAVRVGARNPQESVVVGGLAPNDVVVLYPGSTVREGTRVRATRDR
jgi:HlyD family secretion protein